MQFVDAKDIDYRYFERPYFLVPADEMAGEGYAVIRDALGKTGKVGLAQLTVSGREWLVAVAPLQDGLVMELLRYANELREPAEYFDEVPTANHKRTWSISRCSSSRRNPGRSMRRSLRTTTALR